VQANVFLPASEHGSAGIDEVHQQTVNLMGFQPMPKKVFDEQVAFNLMPAWGEEASAGKLLSVEQTVRAQLQALAPMARDLPASVRCLQAGVFHCLSASLHLQFAQPMDEAELAGILKGDLVDLWSANLGAPTHLSAVGETGIVLGDVRPDAASPHSYWLWMVADNLRLRAASAIATARIWLA
jgi:aspartate-semialdehyde dehydrogenase